MGILYRLKASACAGQKSRWVGHVSHLSGLFVDLMCFKRIRTFQNGWKDIWTLRGFSNLRRISWLPGNHEQGYLWTGHICSAHAFSISLTQCVRDCSEKPTLVHRRVALQRKARSLGTRQKKNLPPIKSTWSVLLRFFERIPPLPRYDFSLQPSFRPIPYTVTAISVILNPRPHRGQGWADTLWVMGAQTADKDSVVWQWTRIPLNQL